MKHSLMRSSPVVRGNEIKTSTLKNKFFKSKGRETSSAMLNPYDYEVYVHVTKVFPDTVILNGIQFSSDGNVCWVKDFSYPFEDFNKAPRTTKAMYNKKILMGGKLTKHILAK